MKVLTVIGARPQFIKALPVSRELKLKGVEEYIVHTGQHYDHSLSKIFFDELGDVEPDVNLMIGSGSHAVQTGHMMIKLEEVMLYERPDLVMVYGDTNSTLAGAVAAVKLHIPVIHIESGLRSYNRIMPEEHNRVLTDHCSTLLICPTENARSNLAKEGIIDGVHVLGDTMYDSVLRFIEYAERESTILSDLEIKPGEYLLATVHRAENTDDDENIRNIFDALATQEERVILPLHPRTRKRLQDIGYEHLLRENQSSLRIIEPLGYLDMIMLEKNARIILTDSGGIQKEAYFLSTPCITLRNETEWVETVEAGWNKVVGADKKSILESIRSFQPNAEVNCKMYGDGRASRLIVNMICKYN